MSLHKRDDTKEREEQRVKKKKEKDFLVVHVSFAQWPKGRDEQIKQSKEGTPQTCPTDALVPGLRQGDQKGSVFIADPWTGLRPGVRMRG